MKVNITIKNNRGGKKSTSDNTRIIAELSYRNLIVGELSFYPIIDEGEDLGYRVLWNNEVIEKKEKAKKQKDEILCSQHLAGNCESDCKYRK